jgi:tRNA (guanine-N7-)-methyltransferase
MIVRRPRRLPLETLAPCLLHLPVDAGLVSWPAVFGNAHPVEIEIGFGKGLFLLNSSQARPDCNFLGIEILRKYQLFTANRLAKRNLGNVRLVCSDARTWLARHVPPCSVDAIHIYFPDPWWKTRHRKRRLFTPEFVAACRRIFVPGGRLIVVTDVQDYFEEIARLLADDPGLYPQPQGEEQPSEYRTNFERKYREGGRPIHSCVYRKREENADGKSPGTG